MNFPTVYSGEIEDLPDYFRREVSRLENHYGLLQRIMRKPWQPGQSITREIRVKITNPSNPNDLRNAVHRGCIDSFCYEERWIVRGLTDYAINSMNSAHMKYCTVDVYRDMVSRLRPPKDEPYSFLAGHACWSELIASAPLNSVELPYTLLEVQAGMLGQLDHHRVMGDHYRHPMLRCLDENSILAFTSPGIFEASNSDFALEDGDELYVTWKRTTRMDLSPDRKAVIVCI